MKSKKRPILANIKTCTGCLACVDSCNFNALKAELQPDGHLYPKVNLDNCTQCGLCTKTCPVVSNFTYQSGNDTSEPYAAWNNNDELRMNSASGGVFAAIAEKILSEGGFVAGATMDGLKVKHILINKKIDIPKLQGSKYQQSNSTGIYKASFKKLKEGSTVFFSGLPCQIAGLLSFLKNKKYTGKLYTADMICSGVPSYLNVEKYCNHNNLKIKTFTYTTKDLGWKKSKRLTVFYPNSNETLATNRNNLIYGSFLRASTNRFSCYDCQYTYHNRKSDLTLADFWGLEDYPDEHFKGVSLVITHSEKGNELLTKSNITINKTNWKKCIPYNPRLVYGKNIFEKYKFSRKKIVYIYKTTNYDKLLKIYASIINRKEILWLPLKLTNYIYYKISIIIQKRYIKTYLRKKLYEN